MKNRKVKITLLAFGIVTGFGLIVSAMEIWSDPSVEFYDVINRILFCIPAIATMFDGANFGEHWAKGRFLGKDGGTDE